MLANPPDVYAARQAYFETIVDDERERAAVDVARLVAANTFADAFDVQPQDRGDGMEAYLPDEV